MLRSTKWCAAVPGSRSVPALRRSVAPRPGHELLRRVLLAHLVDQGVFPIRQAAKRQRGGVGAAVVHVAVELPGEAHAAMDLDVVLGAVLKRLRRADARGSGSFFGPFVG